VFVSALLAIVLLIDNCVELLVPLLRIIDLSDGNDLYCVGGICSETPTGIKYTSSAVYKLGTSNSNAYAWSTGENTSSINVTPAQSNTYSCTVTQGNTTCTASVDLTVNPNINNAIECRCREYFIIEFFKSLYLTVVA
jgi:hypothetical protein